SGVRVDGRTILDRLPMRTRSFILVATLLVALFATAAAVYAYDRSKRDVIAKGVQVNGVDVGGLTSPQAARTLRATLLAPLDRPVKVRYRKRRFTLTPREAAIGIDIGGSVAQALERARDADLFSRAWR